MAGAVVGLVHFQVNPDEFNYSETREPPTDAVVRIYAAHGWSSANKPETLINWLAWAKRSPMNFWWSTIPICWSFPITTAAASGKKILRRLKAEVQGFHPHILVADGQAVEFHRKCGFTRAGKTQSMTIYSGDDY